MALADDIPLLGPGALVTVTMNPALDVSTAVDAITPELKLRCAAVQREPGGGGVNVARVARRLGIDVTAVIVVGGLTGQQVVALAEAEGLVVHPITTTGGETRESMSVYERSTGRQYRFVVPGPAVDDASVAELVVAVRAGHPMACLVISGSLPPATPPGTLDSLVAAAPDKAAVIIDTSGPALVEALATPATLVKPSARELGSVVDRELETEADVLDAAQEVMASSAVDAMLVSIGPGGALLVAAGQPPVRFRAPTVKVRSTVGAGDSLVAGVATGLCQGMPLADAAALGVAAGTAAVVTAGSQLAEPEMIDRLRRLVAVSS